MNRSTYYKHFKQNNSSRVTENQVLKNNILTLYSLSKKRLGAYKIRQRLLVEYGKQVSVGRVYRLMKSMCLPKMSTVKPVSAYLKSELEEHPNYLQQKFNPKEPNLIWVSDITYIQVSGRFVYLCVVIDLYSRKVIAYKTSSRIDTKLVIDTFSLAYKKRGYPKGVMFHSDQGCQYTSKAFRKVLDQAEFVQSFSAKAHPYDNAVAESFFKYIKKEELNRRVFKTLQEVNLSLFEYIESFYNKRRPHSANHYLSPDEKEDKFFQN